MVSFGRISQQFPAYKDRSKPLSPWMTRQVGATHGLRLTLDLHVDDYVGMTTADIGAKIIVHYGRHMAEPSKKGFLVRPGQLTSVALKATRFERLQAPYSSKCARDFPEIYMNYSTPNVSYSLDECKNACWRRQVWLDCQCVEHFNIVQMWPLRETLAPEMRPDNCFVMGVKTIECVDDAHRKYTELHVDATKQVDDCACPPPCREETFEPFISTSDWPSPAYENAMVIQPLSSKDYNYSKVVKKIRVHSMFNNDDYVRRNLAEVHIYLLLKEIYVIKEEPDYELSQLASDLGGVIGLHLGMAIASAVELAELVVMIMYAFIFGGSDQKTKKSNHLDMTSGSRIHHRNADRNQSTSSKRSKSQQ